MTMVTALERPWKAKRCGAGCRDAVAAARCEQHGPRRPPVPDPGGRDAQRAVFREQWMNAHETTATWNIAETCVDSLRLHELLALSGDADNVLVANGAIGANFLVLFALVEPGDTVVYVKPTYQQLSSVPEALAPRSSTSACARRTATCRASTRRCCARSSPWPANAAPGSTATRSTASWSTSRGRRRRRSPTCTRRA